MLSKVHEMLRVKYNLWTSTIYKNVDIYNFDVRFWTIESLTVTFRYFSLYLQANDLINLIVKLELIRIWLCRVKMKKFSFETSKYSSVHLVLDFFFTRAHLELLNNLHRRL